MSWLPGNVQPRDQPFSVPEPVLVTTTCPWKPPGQLLTTEYVPEQVPEPEVVVGLGVAGELVHYFGDLGLGRLLAGESVDVRAGCALEDFVEVVGVGGKALLVVGLTAQAGNGDIVGGRTG